MTRRLISSGSTFEEQIGYSRAVVDGDWIHVSGTTGFDYATMTIADDVVAQAEQCLTNIAAARPSRLHVRRRRPRPLHPPQPRRLRALLATVPRSVRRQPPGGNDDRVRPHRPADAHRDRGHRPPI
jgi:hypothetical protein